MKLRLKQALINMELVEMARGVMVPEQRIVGYVPNPEGKIIDVPPAHAEILIQQGHYEALEDFPVEEPVVEEDEKPKRTRKAKSDEE